MFVSDYHLLDDHPPFCVACEFKWGTMLNWTIEYTKLKLTIEAYWIDLFYCNMYGKDVFVPDFLFFSHFLVLLSNAKGFLLRRTNFKIFEKRSYFYKSIYFLKLPYESTTLYSHTFLNNEYFNLSGQIYIIPKWY